MTNYSAAKPVMGDAPKQPDVIIGSLPTRDEAKEAGRLATPEQDAVYTTMYERGRNFMDMQNSGATIAPATAEKWVQQDLRDFPKMGKNAFLVRNTLTDMAERMGEIPAYGDAMRKDAPNLARSAVAMAAEDKAEKAALKAQQAKATGGTSGAKPGF